MPRSLSGRSFLKLLDFTTEEIQYLLELAKDFKRLKRTNTPHKYLTGKNIRRAPAARLKLPVTTWVWV